MEKEVTVLRAAVKHWVLVVVPLVLCIVGASFLAEQRETNYRAEARLYVGGFDARVQAVPGIVEASKSLAAAYSRLATTPAVLTPAAEAAGVSPGELGSHISVSPIVGSPIIAVRAESLSSEVAVKYAEATATALKQHLDSASPVTSEEVLSRFQTANSALNRAQLDLQRLQDRKDAKPDPLPGAAVTAEDLSLDQQIAEKQAEVATKKLESDALSGQYTTNQSGQSFGVQIIEPGRPAGDDRSSQRQLWLFFGAFVGAVLGTALAVLRASVKRHRMQLQREQEAQDAGKTVDLTSSTERSSADTTSS